MARRTDCAADVSVPADARLTDVYWQRPENAGRATFDADAPFGLPFRPSPFRARVEMDNGRRAHRPRACRCSFATKGAGLVGEKRMELNVVPAFAVSVSPQIVVVPRSPARTAAPAGRELRVTVINGAKGPASTTVRLKTPAGWRCRRRRPPISFTREDESTTTRFTVTPSAAAPPASSDDPPKSVSGRHRAAGASTFGSGLPGHRVPAHPAASQDRAGGGAVQGDRRRDPAGLTVGYIMGVGDQVPAALRQLGARVTLIDSDEMAWGDLSQIQRHRHRRARLRAARGPARQQSSAAEVRGERRNGHRSVQPAGVQPGAVRAVPGADEHERITDENAPVKILVPGHPVFNVPNKINDRDWQGWVQERGTYFLEQPLDAEIHRSHRDGGSLRVQQGTRSVVRSSRRAYGKGRWLYVGLGPVAAAAIGHRWRVSAFRESISLGRPPAKPRPVASRNSASLDGEALLAEQGAVAGPKLHSPLARTDACCGCRCGTRCRYWRGRLVRRSDASFRPGTSGAGPSSRAET